MAAEPVDQHCDPPNETASRALSQAAVSWVVTALRGPGMFRLIVPLAGSVRAMLPHAPTNRFLRWLHARLGIVATVAAMAAGVAYLFTAAVCTVLLDRGGPGWLNILVVLFLYNGVKLALHGLVMGAMLVRNGLRSSRHGRPARSSRAVADRATGHPSLR